MQLNQNIQNINQRAQQISNSMQVQPNHFIKISQFKLNTIESKDEKIYEIYPALRNSYIVASQETNGNGKQKWFKHLSSQRQIIDYENFGTTQKILSVAVLNEKYVLIFYYKIMQPAQLGQAIYGNSNNSQKNINQQTKRFFLFQWDLQTNVKITVKLNKIPNKNQYQMISFQNLICIIESSIGYKRKQYNQNKIMGQIDTYSHKFMYYHIPIKNVNAKPKITLQLRNINVKNFIKINEEQKIAITLNQIMMQERTLKFYVISIKQKLEYQLPILQNANKNIEEYCFRYEQQFFQQLNLQNIFQFQPNIFYIKCSTTPNLCCLKSQQMFGQPPNRRYSYIWNSNNKNKQNKPIKLNIPSQHDHNVQIISNLRQIPHRYYQQYLKDKQMKYNTCSYVTYIYEYINDNFINQLAKYTQKWQQLIFLDLNFQYTKYDKYNNHFIKISESFSKLQILKLSQFVFGKSILLVFLLQQIKQSNIIRQDEEYFDWNEDLCTEVCKMIL